MTEILKSKYSADNFDVSVIIVNYNAGKYLEETINSLRDKTNEVSYEIILIDNNSNNEEESYKYLDTLIKYENVTIVKSSENLGFAKANNLGMTMAKGRNFLIFNPDVILHNNVLKILSEYLDCNKEAGMVGPKVLNTDGSFQQPCFRGKPYPKDCFFHLIGLAKAFPKCEALNGYALWHLDRDKIQECWALSGACMMVKRELFEKIGGIDEQYFMYQEETDWGLETKKAGYKIVYNPNAVVTHYKGVTTKKIKVKSVWIFTQSMLKFYKKHFWSNCNIFQKAFWITLIYCNFFLKIIVSTLKK